MKLGKANKKLMAMILAAAEVMTVFHIGTFDTSAESAMTQAECKDIVSTYSVDDSVPGYKEYQEQHAGAAYPNAKIEVDAADYVSYQENDIETEPEVYSNYEGVQGDSILTSESAYVEYEVEVPETGFYKLEVQ